MSKSRDIVETLRTVLVDGDVTNANFTGADLDITKGGTGASSAGAARTALGLAIGSDVQAHDADTAKLDAAANFTGTLQRSGTNVLVAGDVTNANFTGADLEIGKGGTGSSTAPAARTALGLAIGSDVQAYDANTAKLDEAANFTNTLQNGGSNVIVDSDIGTTVLAPNGSAANLTNLPAGGAEDFVASGTLPNGKPVILKANGQVEVVGTSGVQASIPSGSLTTFEAASSNRIQIAFDPNNGSKFVLCYQDTGNGEKGTAIIGTVSNNSISFGSPVVFNAGNTLEISVSFDPATANQFVVVCRNQNNNNYGTSYVGTVSSTSISFGSGVVFNSGTTSNIRIAFSGAANIYVIAYKISNSNGSSIVGTVSSNSSSFGTPFKFLTGNALHISLAADPNNTNKLVLSFQHENATDGKVAILTRNSTSLTVGTAVTFDSTGQYFGNIKYDPITANRFLLGWSHNAGNILKAVVGSVSGTSITLGTVLDVQAIHNSGIEVAFDPSNVNLAVISYHNSGAGNPLMLAQLTLSGNSVTTLTPVVVKSTGTTFPAVGYTFTQSGKIVQAFTDTNASNHGKAIVSQTKTFGTNLTSTNFLGTATAAYTNGQTASIVLKGGISENQTSLAIGSIYYVQPAGTFATTKGVPPVLAGKAVSATSLLLNGLDDLQDAGATSINGLSDGYNDNSSLGLGTNALANDDGSANLSTAVGTSAMTANTTGYHNAAIGSFALAANTTGYRHVSVGAYSLYFNTTSNSNTASGYKSMFDNTTGSNNAATGTSSLENNTTGNRNTANGYDSLKTNTTGANNSAYGMNSLLRNATGSSNTASGYRALENNTTANENTASGMYALAGNTTGTNNTGVGHSANGPSGTQSNTITLGDANVTVLRCNDTSISGLSDRRDKTNITNLPESAGLGIINALRPVTFNWDRREWYDNNTPDGSKIMLDWRRWKAHSGLKYGFIAQEVQATIAGEKCMADSNIVSDENLDRIEFAPQHLLTNAIKAIQQLSTENEALKIRLTALENA